MPHFSKSNGYSSVDVTIIITDCWTLPRMKGVLMGAEPKLVNWQVCWFKAEKPDAED
jgi:hypothetical protein